MRLGNVPMMTPLPLPLVLLHWLPFADGLEDLFEEALALSAGLLRVQINALRRRQLVVSGHFHLAGLIAEAVVITTSFFSQNGGLSWGQNGVNGLQFYKQTHRYQPEQNKFHL